MATKAIPHGKMTDELKQNPVKRTMSYSGNVIKKRKKSKDESSEKHLDEVEFKVMMQDESNRVDVLLQFVEQNKMFLDGEISFDIVSEYCQSSRECKEILDVLNEGKQNQKALCSIFMALETILMRIAGDLSKFSHAGMHIVNQLLAAHLNKIYFLMDIQNKASHMKASLKLLIAMVVQDVSSAQSVFSHIDWNHRSWQSLINRTNVKDEQDVRTCYLHLLMSFLITGDNGLAKQLAECKGLLNSSLSRISRDKPHVIQLVLSTLLENVVKNPSVNKTAKIRLFNDRVLKDIAKLYIWTRDVDIKDKTDHKDDALHWCEILDKEESEDERLIRDAVHTFFVELCCTFKTGINFYDKAFGSSGKNHNHCLTQLLTILPKPALYPRFTDLVIKVLVACPDQLHWFLPHLKNSLEPRNTTNWKLNFQFLKKIYKAQPDVWPVFLNTCDLPGVKRLNAAVNLVLPPKEILNHILTCVRHSDRFLQHCGLDLISLLLQKMLTSFQALNKTSENEEFIDSVKDAVLKLLPNVSQLVNMWNQTLKDTDKIVQDAKIQPPEKATAIDKQTLQTSILKLLCLYQSVFPNPFSETNLDLASLLEGLQSGSDLHIYILKLLSGSDVQKIQWFKQSSSGKTTLFLLLELLKKSDKDLRSLTVKLLHRLFTATRIFDNCTDELFIWLKSLSEIQEEDWDETIVFFNASLTEVIKDPYSFLERINDLISETCSEHTESDVSSGKSVDEIVKSILSEEEVSINSNGQVDTFQPAPTNERFAFSPLVLSSLDLLTSKKPNKDVCAFIKHVLCKIVLLQVEPVYICRLLFEHRIVDSIIAVWNEPNEKKLIGKYIYGSDLDGIIRNAFIDNQAVLVEKLPQSEIEDIPRLTKMTMVYINAYSEAIRKDKSLCKAKELKQIISSYFNVLQCVIANARSEGEVNDDLKNNTINENVIEIQNELQDENEDESMDVSEINESEKDLSESNKTEENDRIDVKALEISTPSADECITSALEFMLNHPLTKQLFLMSNIETESYVQSKYSNLSQTFTSCMAKFLAHFPNAGNITGLKAIYLPRYIDVMKASLNHKTIQKGKFPVEMSNLALLFFPLIENDVFVELCNQLFILPDVSDEHLMKLVLLSLEKLINDDTIPFPDENAFRNAAVQLSKRTSNCLQTLVSLIQKKPLFVISLDKEFMQNVSRLVNGENLELVKLMVKHSFTARKWFETISELMENKQAVTCYLECTDDVKPAVIKTIKKLHNITTKSELNDDEDVDLLIALSRHSTAKFIVGIFENLLSVLAEMSIVSAVHVKAFMRLYYELCRLEEKENITSIRKHVQKLFQVLIIAMKTQKDKAVDESMISVNSIVKEILLKDTNLIEESIIDEYWTIDWNQFVKLMLRYHLEDEDCLQLITKVVKIWNSSQTQSLHGMILGHSHFLPILMSDDKPKLKEKLVILIHQIVALEPSVCDVKHVSFILGAFEGTMSTTDQYLLSLLKLYEDQGLSLAEYKPFLWGPKGVEMRLAQNKKSLTRKPYLEQIVQLISEDKMKNSALNFPLRRNFNSLVDKSNEELCVVTSKQSDVYDPCFFIPLLAHAVSSECVVKCPVFVESGLLGYTLSALSSHNDHIRVLAYHILTSFYTHSEGSKYVGKEQVMSLLECIKNSVEQENGKLACIITVFLAKLTDIILKPEGTMYQVLNAFILLKPNMDVMNVPEFYNLFNSSSQDYKQERSWMLQLLIDGLRETADYRIFEKRYTMKLVLSFCLSDLSDVHCQQKVLDIVKKAVSIRTVATNMFKSGLLQWLSSAVATLPSMFLDHFVDIFSALWFTLLEGSKECLPIAFTHQILIILLQISTIHNEFPSKELFEKYICCLRSVLEHLGKTKEYHKITNNVNIDVLEIHLKDVSRILSLYHKLVNDTNYQSNNHTEKKPQSNEHSLECNIMVIIAHSDGLDVVSYEFESVLQWFIRIMEECIHDQDTLLKGSKWLMKCLNTDVRCVENFIRKTESSHILISRLANLHFKFDCKHLDSQKILNKVFLILADYSMKHCTNDKSQFVQLVQSKMFQAHAQEISDCEEISQQLLALFCQELVFGCEKPVHSVIEYTKEC